MSGTHPVRFDVHLHLSQYWEDQPRTFYRADLPFTVDGLLAEMDEEGIESGLLLQVETSPTVAETLREGGEMQSRSRGRLLRTSTVDPTLGAETVADAIRQWDLVPDLRAIKLYPGYRFFYPHDPRLLPVYEFAARKRLVVMFHQGDTLSADGLVKYSRPIEVDEVAVGHRDVQFVLCHLGNPWIEEAAEVVYKNENVYTDTSGLCWSPRLPLYDRMVERAGRRLQNLISTVGSVDRILYGSDWPLESLKLAVRRIVDLDLSAEDQRKILGENARRLFRLEPAESGSSIAGVASGAGGLRAP